MQGIKWFGFIFLTLLISCTAYAKDAAQTDIFPNTLKLGDQTWTRDNLQQDDAVALAEYVTKNEKSTNWSQLVTFQMFKFQLRPDATPQLFADNEYKQLIKIVPKAQFNIISTTTNEGMVEFRVVAPKDKQQDELQRIVITPKHKLIVIHYVVSKADMGQADRKKWMDILKGIDLPFMKDGDTTIK